MQAQHQGNHLLGVQIDAALGPCLLKESAAFADRLGRFLGRQSQFLASALQRLAQHQALVQPAGGGTGALLNSHAPSLDVSAACLKSGGNARPASNEAQTVHHYPCRARRRCRTCIVQTAWQHWHAV